MEKARSFYESYGRRRFENPLEEEYDRLAARWKVEVMCRSLSGFRINSILEFGCGSGFVLLAFRNSLSPARMVGIDLSSAQLAMASRIVPNGSFVRGDDSTLAGLRGRFDLVLLVDILEHVGDPTSVLRSAARLGTLVMVKMPLERRLIDKMWFHVRGRQYPLGLDSHRAGHLVEWNLTQALSLLREARMEVMSWQTADPPVGLRYHALFRRSSRGLIRELLASLNRGLEIATCERWPRAHAYLYGTSLFALCRGTAPDTGGAAYARIGDDNGTSAAQP